VWHDGRVSVDPNQHDRFVLKQRIRLVINQYGFFLPDDEETPFCFVEQKRFKFKEDIRFYTDDSKTTELMRLKARQRFDPAARYDITTPDGQMVGQIQKQFGASLLRSTYSLYDAYGNPAAKVRERNLPVAIFRRLVGFLPYVGNYADWLPIAYDFEFLQADTDKLLGINARRRWKIRDIYDIDLTPDTERFLDRRLVLAATVGMDALQAR
jgi:uncharacterized protein YxjI